VIEHKPTAWVVAPTKAPVSFQLNTENLHSLSVQHFRDWTWTRFCCGA